MKNLILFLCLVFSTSLLAQKKAEFKKVQFAFGMALNLESLDKEVAEAAGVSALGFTLIDFRGRLSLLKIVQLNIGWNVSQFKDKLPFSEAVVFASGQLSGLPSTATSEIVSGSWYYSVGARAPLSTQLYVNANIGQRRFSATRKITECRNCMKRDLDLDAGSFLQGGLSWMSFTEKTVMEVDLLYSYYFNQEFLSTITLGFFGYF